jgi:hypothetical protein
MEDENGENDLVEIADALGSTLHPCRIFNSWQHIISPFNEIHRSNMSIDLMESLLSGEWRFGHVELSEKC